MTQLYDEGIKLTKKELAFFNDYADVMVREMILILKSNSIDSIEKIFTFVRYQSLDLIRIYNGLKDSSYGEEDRDVFADYNSFINPKINNIYYSLIDNCVNEKIFREDVNKYLIFDTIQDIIVYFAEIYYETKKIDFSLNYLQEAIKLLIDGLRIKPQGA